MSQEPLFISKEGGTIHLIKGDSGIFFRVCSDHLSLYCHDLVSAKMQLERLEEFRGRSYCINMEPMKQEGESLRNLVELSAAPYLRKDD
ncbi:hypothetical protein [Prochlorococcus sp. MIT 1341]|uniref:hypothetical protein n=1 Tax=Prochlorococcus sp. MIT 1341 TaxID=3096221 RepID=UPI002A75DAE3|nr:hypothetical protein [Prochlorococcus sp. MIT 1341]